MKAAEASRVAKARLKPSRVEKGWPAAPAGVPPHGAGGRAGGRLDPAPRVGC